MNIRLIIFKILPEGKFKESFGKVFFRYHNSLYALNKLTRKIELPHGVNGAVLLELANGLKLYGNHNKPLPRAYGISKQNFEFKYGNHKKLDKLNKINADYFGDLLSILRTIFVVNIYEKKYALKEGDIIVDLGANIGAFTVKAAKIVGGRGKIIAVEPEERNLRCLEKNIEINELRNCVVVPKGVWSKKSRMKFFLGPASGWHSLVRERDTFMERPFTEIVVDTLDNILTELEINKVDFIKMDREGSEIEALKGMEENLKKNNDAKLAIEAFHVVDGKPTSETIIPQLKKLEFEVCEEGGFVYARK